MGISLGVIVFIKSLLVVYSMPNTILRPGREKRADSAESWPGSSPWFKTRR